MKRLLLVPLALALASPARAQPMVAPAAAFAVRFSRTVRSEPVAGRVLVAITLDGASEPRLQVGDITGAPFFGVDVSFLRPGDAHDFDLTDYLMRSWSRIGPSLSGQLHVYNPDMDQFFLNLAVYHLEDFLRSAVPPAGATIVHGRPPQKHGWHPLSSAALVQEMADHVPAHAPADEPPARWRY